MFHLTIEVEDIDRFPPTRRGGRRHGYIECDALGGRLPVERGVFNLFVDTEPGVKRMLYRLYFRDGVGHPLTLSGHKVVAHDAGLRRLARHHDAVHARAARARGGGRRRDRRARGSGVLRIRIRDFANQLTTFRAGGPSAGRSSARSPGSAGSSSASWPRPTCERDGAPNGAAQG